MSAASCKLKDNRQGRPIDLGPSEPPDARFGILVSDADGEAEVFFPASGQYVQLYGCDLSPLLADGATPEGWQHAHQS